VSFCFDASDLLILCRCVYRPGWLGLRRGAFTCVGWQVTLLCDPIWQVTFRSSVMGFPLRVVLGFNLSGAVQTILTAPYGNNITYLLNVQESVC